MDVWDDIVSLFTKRIEDDRENSDYVTLTEEEFYNQIKPGTIFEINIKGIPTTVKLLEFANCGRNNILRGMAEGNKHRDFILSALCTNENNGCRGDLVVEVIDGEPLTGDHICGRDSKSKTIDIKIISLSATVQSTQN
jgi:hypothetical protein